MPRRDLAYADVLGARREKYRDKRGALRNRCPGFVLYLARREKCRDAIGGVADAAVLKCSTLLGGRSAETRRPGMATIRDALLGRGARREARGVLKRG